MSVTTLLGPGGATEATLDAIRQELIQKLEDSVDREFTHKVATLTTAGDHTIHIPAAGKRVRLRWISAINDPMSQTSTLISVLLGDEEKYRQWALQKHQQVTGPVDGPLVINLSDPSTRGVAVTVLLEEI